MPIPLLSITRPDGRSYRPRKITTMRWEGEAGELGGVIVLGTHDVERARPLAQRACAYWFGVRYAIKPWIGWFRDGFESGRRSWVQDPVHGRAGVSFTASDELEPADG